MPGPPPPPPPPPPMPGFGGSGLSPPPPPPGGAPNATVLPARPPAAITKDRVSQHYLLIFIRQIALIAYNELCIWIGWLLTSNNSGCSVDGHNQRRKPKESCYKRSIRTSNWKGRIDFLCSTSWQHANSSTTTRRSCTPGPYWRVLKSR